MEASPGEVTMPFRTLDRRSLRAEEPGLFVARTADQWARLWQRMTSHLGQTPPQPTVDWSTEMVVVLALGTRATGGYTVEIEEIRPDGTRWTFTVARMCQDERAPSPMRLRIRIMRLPWPRAMAKPA